MGDWDHEGSTSGIDVISRWPITQHERHPLRGDDGDGMGEACFAAIDGPRGPVQLFVVMLDYPLHASGLRQAQVRQLAHFVARTTHRRHPIVVCGDFNAGPDSDEVRMLTGRSETPVPGLVFYDAGSWLVTEPPATRGPTATRSPRPACTPIAASTTSSPPGPGLAESGTPHTANCWEPH